MEALKTYIDQVENKTDREWLAQAIEDLKVGGKDCFRVQQICFNWCFMTGEQRAFDFKTALDNYLYN